MRILVVGNGAREHALVWRLSQSPDAELIIAAPGNTGIAGLVTCHNIAVTDMDGLVDLARLERIDFVVVGPEAPLTLGLVDRLAENSILALGPGAEAARLEGSKAFTKALCAAHQIPTAAFETFVDADLAKAYVRARGAPIVIKADGLAAGKGVVVATNLEEALAAIDHLLDVKLGGRIVVEECLFGEEVSFFALCDGSRALSLGAAQDHKRAFDGDLGPNTGGMGAYGPAAVFTPAIEARVMNEIINPTLAAMAQNGTPFRGILFAGLMIEPTGAPRLIEFNVRLGDPETQVLMMRLEGDLLAAFLASARGDLSRIPAFGQKGAAICVVMAAEGYPGTPKTGTIIRLPADPGPMTRIFHAGTGLDTGGQLVAQGGRVLSITAKSDGLAAARQNAYDVIDRIDWPGGFCRRDIGWRALDR